MAHENGILELERAADLHHLLGVAVEALIELWGIGLEIGPPVSHIVEEDDTEVVLEGSSNGLPHGLIAAKAMREHHRSLAATRDVDVVPAHDRSLRKFHGPGRNMLSFRAKRLCRKAVLEGDRRRPTCNKRGTVPLGRPS